MISISSEAEEIHIDKYIQRGTHFYAVIGKKQIQMPDDYKEMYDDDHLVIKQRTTSGIFTTTPITEYIPLRSSK